ncbi:MAG: hypothetical protein ACP5RI_01620 [Candidatus Micrarchaeia archaeon]
MGILDFFGRGNKNSNSEKTPIYMIFTEWVPYKLYSNRKSSSKLNIRIKNMTKDVALTSVSISLPPQLSFDNMSLEKEKTIKIGEIQPQEEKEVNVDVMTTLNSDPGEYTITLTATSHYRDYDHVINSIEKKTTVQVI